MCWRISLKTAILILISKNLVFHSLLKLLELLAHKHIHFIWINHSYIIKYLHRSCLYKKVSANLYFNLNWDSKMKLKFIMMFNLFYYCLNWLKSNCLQLSHKIFFMPVHIASFYDIVVYKMKILKYLGH